MMNILTELSNWIIPFLLVFIPLFGHFKGIKVYEAFTDGAAEAFSTVVKIIPYLLAMMIAINVFRESGALNVFLDTFKPLFDKMGIPEPVIPLFLLRPLSGSGSLSYVSQLFKEFGPDSFVGKLASTIQGSTETTFYIIAVYFGALGIKKYRYAVIVGVIADFAGFFAAVFISKLIFKF